MADATYAIIIPTCRHLYLDRLVDYYDYLGQSPHVMVLDSCDTPWERTPPQGLAYHHLPGMAFMDRISTAMAHTDAQYISMCADDDFVIPSVLKSCVQFLDAHPDHCSAFGRAVRFSIKNSIVYNEQYPRDSHRDLAQGEPAARLLDILDRYIQLFYSVHHRRVFERIVNIPEMRQDAYFINACGERIFTLLPPLMGKVKYLNEAFVLREQENSKSHGYQSYLAIAKAWSVFSEVMLRLLGEFEADSPTTREALAFFLEKWIYTHFNQEIMKRGEPKAADYVDQGRGPEPEEDKLAYITHQGNKFIPSDFRGISPMGFDHQTASEEAIQVADQFLKRFVRQRTRSPKTER